jgi:peptidoglycan/LPS O-acetylase OafA/YrhL
VAPVRGTIQSFAVSKFEGVSDYMSTPAVAASEKLVRPVMPELDSLRGVAILLVLFFHGFNYQGAIAHFSGLPRLFIISATTGWTGVYLFFVLSGFLITGILLDSKRKPHYYRRFYIRRALRILPAFYLLLILLVVLTRVGWLEGRRIGWPFVTLSFFYLANVTNFFGVPAQYAALWSLAVEEHFYLLWPTVIRSLSRRTAAWCAVAIFVTCPILRAFAYWHGYNYDAGYTWQVADGLAIGALMGILSRGQLAERGPMRRFSTGCLAAALVLFAVGTPFGIWRGSTFFGGVFRLTAVDLFAAGILGSTLLLGTSRFKWIVCRPVLQWFGEISYGLYLIHMMAFDFVNHWIARDDPNLLARIPGNLGLMSLRFLIGAAVAVGLAFLSRRYFEEWFLRLKERWTPPASTAPVQPLVAVRSV